jgi:hypothetical protein
MSQTRKEIIAALDAEAAARKQEQEAHVAEVATLTAEIEAQKQRADSAEAALKAETEAHAATKAAAEKQTEEQVACVGTALASLKAETEAHAATVKHLDLAKQALADPAFVDAAMTAFNGGKSLQASRDAEADAAEAAAASEKPRAFMAELNAIEDPKERRAFYVANEQAIKAELKQQNGGK